MDTGKCVPESLETLYIQQRQLLQGKRAVQMFPKGTNELPLPNGFQRFVNERGIFHFNGSKITRKEIATLSAKGAENRFLNLGPYSKPEIDERVKHGEIIVFLTEYLDSIEVRSVACTNLTVKEQYEYLEKTKEPNSVIVAEPPKRVLNHGN